MSRILTKLPGLAWVTLVTIWAVRRVVPTDFVPRVIESVRSATQPLEEPDLVVSMTDPVAVSVPA